MESTTVRTDFRKNEKGEHIIVRTTMTVKRTDAASKDEEPSDELHTTEETVRYEPAPKPAIDQATPCIGPAGKPATDSGLNWIAPSSAAASWPEEMK